MTDLLLLTFIFLCAGVLAVPIATRFGLGSVLGYLIAGIAISPVLALFHVDVDAIQHFAEFGVVMMLFLVGLELEPRVLWQMRAKLIGLGGLQVLGTAAAVTAFAMALGMMWNVALAIGLVFSLSSTAIVLQSLAEKGLMKSDGGQSSFAVLLFQDIAVIPMLALIPLLALPELVDIGTAVSHVAPAVADLAHEAANVAPEVAGTGHSSGLSLVAGLGRIEAALVTLAAIAAVVLGGGYLTRPIFRFIAMAEARELFTAAALMMVVGIALLMSLVGLSPALGTFLAGVVLANSEYRHELESDIDPFKGLLMGLFFMTVGASINFGLLAENIWLISGLTIGLIATKVGVLLVLGWIFKLKGADKWLMALGLAQAGEFGFVLLSFTVANGVIPTAIADQLLLVVALSMLLTPGLFIIYDRVVVPLYLKPDTTEADDIPGNDKIIIAGCGRVGGMIRRMLSASGHSSTVIDFNSLQLKNMRVFGVRAYFGDATRPDLLHSAGIGDARLLIVAIDGREQITEVVRYVRHNYPKVHVMARAVDRDHVYELWGAGCRDIIRETYDSSIRMGQSAYQALGVAPDRAAMMANAFSQFDRKAMVAVAGLYDPAIPTMDNAPYIAKVNEIGSKWEVMVNAQLQTICDTGIDPGLPEEL
jgi:CPA2 family monovalent cation:H+ antiporter-2